MRFASTAPVRPTIDSASCVAALLGAGFRVQHEGHLLTLLRRGARVVLVPAVGALTPEMLEAILRSAGLTASELEQHLAGSHLQRDAAAPSSMRHEG